MEHAVKAQPSIPAGPECSKCHQTTRYQGAPHSSGDGWHIRAWCDSCQCDANRNHLWYRWSLFTAEQLAALEPQSEVRSTQQLSLLDAANGNDGSDR